MATHTYLGSGKVDFGAIRLQLDRLNASTDFLRTSPDRAMAEGALSELRHRFVEWGNQLLAGERKASEHYDYAGDIIKKIDQMAGQAGLPPSSSLANCAARLDSRARDIEDWLEMRREEHPTWAPMLTESLVELLESARSIITTYQGRLDRADHAPKVEIVSISPEMLRWLAEDISRLNELTPKQFELFVADRLSAMELEVLLVGSTYQRDGGVDIVATPRYATVPFLIAAQVKSHRTGTKTDVGAARDFLGVLTAHPFNMGLLVTNTTFTKPAQWFAQRKEHILRLRDIRDMARWIRGNFLAEEEWREIPERLVLTPGIEIVIPRPTVVARG